MIPWCICSCIGLSTTCSCLSTLGGCQPSQPANTGLSMVSRTCTWAGVVKMRTSMFELSMQGWALSGWDRNRQLQNIQHLSVFKLRCSPGLQLKCSGVGWFLFQKVWKFWTFDWGVLLPQGQQGWAAFCMIFSRIPHSTIFSSPKYVRKMLYLAYLAIFGAHSWAHYGQVWYHWKDHPNCSSGVLTKSFACPPQHSLPCLFL